MEKDRINFKFREYIRSRLSPTENERRIISKIYHSFQELFSEKCFQIGSFPRYTAIRPIHDLDILYVIGEWDEESHNPQEVLYGVKKRIEKDYKNPTNFQIVISLQSHSVTIEFINNSDGVFSIDIVPGYIYDKNEFDQETYKVPEILNFPHGGIRRDYYEMLKLDNREMPWIISDPRGYIEVAKIINESNSDFRKTVKIIKAWKNSCKDFNEDFKLKSFHIEQIITGFFLEQPSSDIFDGVFKFFFTLPDWISEPKIKDRADYSRFIDDYLKDLSIEQKSNIINARDCFLKKLEEFTDNDSIQHLIDACLYDRSSSSEQFMFDFGIPTFLNDDFNFEIGGYLNERDGFPPKRLPKNGDINIDRKIDFNIVGKKPHADYFLWKVKNDNKCEEPRGEVTKGHTRNVPERTKYSGTHFVECYAILDNICVAKARQYVRLRYPGQQ
jgi:hypothetical protein